MYLIDKEANSTSKLKQQTYSQLKFKEREHLQDSFGERSVTKFNVNS
jgi:hypothetical protein